MITMTELAGFLSMHAGFRTEFGRLADACQAPRDRAHEELLEEQIAMVLDVLHDHHVHEDEVIWPFLVTQSPGATADLDALEAEHEVLDPLIRAARDTATPLVERAAVLRRLHEVVNDHLDHEERVAVPLILQHYTPDMVESDKRKATSDFGRRRLAMIYGWVASCLTDEHLATSLSQQPWVVRFLFRRFWWPSYLRRMAVLYGPSVRPVSTTLSTGVAA